MGLPNAMAVLAEQWDDVLSYLEAGQAGRLHELAAQFVAEGNPGASADIAERIMDVLMEALPVSHPVLSALMSSEDRFRSPSGPASEGPLRDPARPAADRERVRVAAPPRARPGPPVAADREWFRLAAPLRARLDPTEPPTGPGKGGPGGYPDEARGSVHAEIAVDIYLDTDDQEVAAKVFDAADSLIRLLGYDSPFDEQIFYGSIFRRAKAVAREAVTSEELRTSLIKIERALELRISDRPQAEVDVREAEAARTLLSGLSDVPQACVRLGSIFVVKYQDAGGPVVLIRNLSQLELHALERFPEIQRNPRQALDALATAVASDDLGEVS